MTGKLQSAGMVLVVLLAAAVGGVALGGTAAALDSGAGAMYPSVPGTDALGTFVYVVRPSDNVVQNGIKRITLNVSSDASVANVTDEDVFISVRGGQRIEIAESGSDIAEVTNLNVSSNAAGDRLTITLPRPVRPRTGGTGAEVAIKIENFTTPSQPGTYTVGGTFAGPAGRTDGPATVSYSVSQPELSMANQRLSQFSDQQTINVSAAIPGGGYVGLFTTTQNGSPDRLVGWMNVSSAPSVENYTIDVNGTIADTQQLIAVAYTESQGRSAGLRAEQSFDPMQDERLVVNGDLVNATATISTLGVDARVTAGNEYDQGAQLYFSQGEPSTGYQIRVVENGSLGPTATQFQTMPNGTAVIDTAELDQGQYAITRIADGSLVSLDNDSTTSPRDDSFLVSGQQMTTTSEATATATEIEGDTATAGNGGGTGAAGGDGADTTGGSNSGGPGFGIAVAVIALLAAALLATRR